MSISGEQEVTAEVNASVDACFATITTFERYPEWFSGIVHSKVIDRYPDGLGKTVEFKMSMPLKTLRYVLEYSYKAPKRLDWKSVDGDIEAIEGSYDLKPDGTKKTLVACRQAISIGFWVPGPLRKLLEQTALRTSVVEFKAAAEADAVANAGARRKKKTS